MVGGLMYYLCDGVSLKILVVLFVVFVVGVVCFGIGIFL